MDFGNFEQGVVIATRPNSFLKNGQVVSETAFVENRLDFVKEERLLQIVNLTKEDYQFILAHEAHLAHLIFNKYRNDMVKIEGVIISNLTKQKRVLFSLLK